MSETPQFWLLYVDLLRNQVMVYTDVQTNDQDMLICIWKMFIPMYFAMKKVNYARLALYLFVSSFNIYYDFNN